MAVRVGVEVQTVAEAVFVLKQAQAVPVEAGVLWGVGAIGPVVGLGHAAAKRVVGEAGLVNGVVTAGVHANQPVFAVVVEVAVVLALG